MPLVSIGLPAHNGGRYIGKTLNSLISQTFRDFELIISDDASTDNTFPICKEFADRDKRIKLFSNEYNIGMLENFRLVFKRSRGRYFMWASNHDVWLPDFIREHVAVLNQFPEVVLAYPLFKDIYGDDEFLPIQHKRFETFGLSKRERVRAVCKEMTGAGYMIYGLFRSNALAETTVHPDLPMPDRFVLIELALHGTYKQIDKYLWYRRHPRSNPSVNDPMTNYEEQISSQRARLFPQGRKPPWRMNFPMLSHAAGFIYYLGIRPSSHSYANAHLAPYITFQHLKRRRRFLVKEITTFLKKPVMTAGHE